MFTDLLHPTSQRRTTLNLELTGRVWVTLRTLTLSVLNRRDIMSKTLTSPVKRWPGTVTLPDYLTIPQAMAWEEAFNNSKDLLPEITPVIIGLDNKIPELTKEQKDYVDKKFSSAWANAILPGIMACVTEWNLEGLDKDNFPATPKQSRIELISWLITEISKLYKEADEIPNG